MLHLVTRLSRTHWTRLRKFNKEKHTSLSRLTLVDKEKGFAALVMFQCYKNTFSTSITVALNKL
jgi:hypothetical protein